MKAEHAIPAPQSADAYPGRDADCLAALRPSAAELAVTSQEHVTIIGANELPDELKPLVDRAEQAGWTRKEAEEALRQLARELAGAQGTIFD